MPAPFEVRPVRFDRRRDRNRFIDVPFHLYPRESNWVPPLRFSVSRLLNPAKNPFFHHARMVGFIARRGRRPIGRIAAIVNDRHNEFHGERTGFFGFFESVNEEPVAHALFDHAGDWLRRAGMDRMRGPMNPSTNDDCGLLINAFDEPPVVMMPYNPPYYASLVESYGFVKAKDLYAYELATEVGVSSRVLRIADVIQRRTKAVIRRIDMKHLRAELGKVRAIYEGAWEKNWGFVPMTPEEFDFAADDLKEAADPDCALIAEIDGQPVGFCLAILDLNQVFRRIPNGRLFPTGLWRILMGRSKIDRVRIILLGILPQYRRRGIDAMFYARLYHVGRTKGYVGGEMSWILEDNEPMREAATAMGARHYKTYRVYDFALEPEAAT